jgi:acyl-CoA thioesterase-1
MRLGMGLALAGAAPWTLGAATGAPGAAASPAPTLLIVGDSLSAEYGLARGTGWPTLLQARLRERRYDYHVVNASISGDTTSGGLSRLPALLAEHHPRIVIIELGSNDGLRGLSLQAAEANLAKMVEASQAAGARVLLVGMMIPPNYGRDYTQRFQQMFGRIAKAHQAALVPFLLDGMAQHIELFQADRLHPVAKAQPQLLDNVWKGLEPLLKARR